jgi:asparagine synthase (glutamine-hydrolysing)
VSAIFGILRFDGDAVAAGDLERMSATLRHRGPDGRKTVTYGEAGLGHCLMRVNQEDLFEAQPLRDRASGINVVADCRIDNREALADRLGIGEGALRDMPDSALVLRAYKAWGEACTEHLVGDFAFAIWDQTAGRLLLGRDHMGQRNLFYHQGERFLAFASEIKALWALADVPRSLSEPELARFYYKTAAQRPEGATLYDSIGALPGGSILAASRDRCLDIRRYWSPGPAKAHLDRDEAYYLEQYRAVLEEAVACRVGRLMTPAALLMSAGFDTTAIAGLASRVVAGGQRKLICLSWLGSDEGRTARGDIRPWLDACRRSLPDLDIREFSAPRGDPMDGLDRIFQAYEGPGGGARRTTYRLFAEARSLGARVVMDGYGGDYTLNPRGGGALARHLRRGRLKVFASEFRARLRAGLPVWTVLRHEVLQMLLPPSLVRWQRNLRRIGAGALSRSALRRLEGPHLRALRRSNEASAAPGRETIPYAAMRAGSLHLTSQISRAAIAAGSTPAAACGLDLTRPFHDKRVVELSLAIPEDLYVKRGLNRYLARQALADIYPPEFQTRDRENVGALGDAPSLDLDAPSLATEADRLAASARFETYFDFDQTRQTLRPDDRSAAGLVRKDAGARALLMLKFIEWFEGSNA